MSIMRFGTLALAVLAAFGCTDSTGPSSIAHHLDALYRQACAAAYDPTGGYANSAGYNTASPYWYRCQMLSVLLAGPASGAEPSPVRVTTATGVETWQGLIIDESDSGSSGAVLDSSMIMIAYRDANVTTAVLTMLFDGSWGSVIYANDTIVANFTSGSVAMSPVTLGARCKDTRGLSNPLADTLTGYPPIEYASGICQLATFDGSMSATFPNTPGLDPALSSVTIDRQSFNGIYVFPPLGFYFDHAIWYVGPRGARRYRVLGLERPIHIE
jgi:hypothetical protein